MEILIKNIKFQKSALNKTLQGNAQFIFLCNAPPKRKKNQGLQECAFTFLQITQKILTKDIFHWLEQITETLSFLKIFSVRKTTTQLF